MAATGDASPAHLDLGKALRKAVPRQVHADWTPPPGRPDPVKRLLDVESRLPALIPLRNARMAANPFTYLRGSAAMMAADLAPTPNAGIRVQACGDAHLSNFAIFATPERDIVFDLNDFDETLPAPFEWDLKRLVASLEVVLRLHGVSTKVRTAVVQSTVETYRRKVLEFADWGALDIWYARISVGELVQIMPRSARASMLRDVDKARRKNHLGALNKLTEVVDGKRRFLADPPMVVPLRDVGADLDEAMSVIESYRLSLATEHRSLFEKFSLVDIAHKVVGVGSVANRCWVGLFKGPKHSAEDPLFLQIKEAGPSVLEAYLGRSATGHAGQRVVAGQRMIQTANDVFLGYATEKASGTQFYVRQLWDVKGSANALRMDLATLTRYADLCAWVLARAHSRTGDAAAIAGYLGKGQSFDKALAQFARRYADQNALDHAAVVQAVHDGVLPSSD